MRDWQVERRKRTRRLIELGGLTGDDRAVIYGALIWMADELSREHGEKARSLWKAKGEYMFEEQHRSNKINATQGKIN